MPSRLRPGCDGDVAPPRRPQGEPSGSARPSPNLPGPSGDRPRAVCPVPRSHGTAHQAEAARQARQDREQGGVGSRKWWNRSGVLGDGWVLTVAEGTFWGKRALERTVGALVMSLECHMIGT